MSVYIDPIPSVHHQLMLQVHMNVNIIIPSNPTPRVRSSNYSAS